MSSNNKRSRQAVPTVHTSRSGSRYVRSIDVIRSEAGRKEIAMQMRGRDTNSATTINGSEQIDTSPAYNAKAHSKSKS